MWLYILDNRTGKGKTVGTKAREVLIGSGKECEIRLSGEGILRQQARFIHASNHHFLIVQQDENGDILPVCRDYPNEYGTNYHWSGSEKRIDAQPFEVGDFTISITRRPDTLWEKVHLRVRDGFRKVWPVTPD